MQLIAIGESVKHRDRVTDGGLLPHYPQVESKCVMGMRDVLSHRYFDVDAEVVFALCEKHIGELADTLTRMMRDLSGSSDPGATPVA